jgi:DivIVA domain-containing protein
MDEAGPEAGPGDAPRLSPDDIASRDFDRAQNGFDDGQVRVFLREIADAVAALRAREHQLEAQVRVLEARATTGTPVGEGRSDSTDEPDPRADDAFARLRATKDEPPPKPPRPSKPAPTPLSTSDRDEEPGAQGQEAVAPPGADEPEVPEADAQPAPEPEATPDERLRAARDALLGPLVHELLRAAKRLLQDEQNVLLDAARRARSRVDPARLLPEPTHHRDAWAVLLAPALGTAYSGGRVAVAPSRRPSSAPERVVNELAAGIIAPLRERLTATTASVLAQGPYESPAELHRELSSALGARYREWRGRELEVRLADALAAAYSRGAYDGAPSGARLRWVKDAAQRCPDCEDNSLEPTLKGQAFPTGQSYPLAHPGCRCLIVPLDASAG